MPLLAPGPRTVCWHPARGPKGRPLAALAEADNPVFYVGGGILLADASEELEALADTMQMPIAHSLMGKGAVRDVHPLVLGMTGFWGGWPNSLRVRPTPILR